MKVKQHYCRIFALLSLALLVYLGPVRAQEKTPGRTKISIRITEEKDGHQNEIVKEYILPEMSEDQRQTYIDQVLDSLDQDGGKQVVSVIVDEDSKRKKRFEDRRELHIKRRINGPEDEDSFAYHWENIEKDLERVSSNIEAKMLHLEKNFSPKTKALMRDIENWGDQFGNKMGDLWTAETSKPSSVQGLGVFTNKPFDGILNVRFHASEKGDVSIRITDTKGKEVGEKKLKDFQGDFVGQVALKKQAQGTLFVTVTLHEDGTVKRIVVP